VSYTYSGGVEEPTLSEFVNSKVESIFGTLSVATPGTKAGTYHRTVPEHLEETFATTNGLLGFLEEASNVVDMSSLVSNEVIATPSPKELGIYTGPDESGPVEENVRDLGEEEASPVGPKEDTQTPSSAAEVRPEMSTDGAESGS
jgi:hypothetical protein